jgi:hypothetical protein
VAQDRAGELGKEPFDGVEPGAVLGSENEFKAVRGVLCDPGSGLFGDVCRIIVEDQLDRGVGRIGGVEKLEEFDEFTASVAILNQGMDLAGDEASFSPTPLPLSEFSPDDRCTASFAILFPSLVTKRPDVGAPWPVARPFR